MKIDFQVETDLSRSPRIRQIEAMFDVPPSEKSKLSWTMDAPIDEKDWNVGLILGPSGSGKTLTARHLYGKKKVEKSFRWNSKSVIDDFGKSLSIQDITNVCQAVGFNTIPAWMRPYKVLSNGEKFRVEIARRLLEDSDPIVIDEFTSVVDRQVAKIASHAVQKYIRKTGRKFVGVSCHYDIIDWLNPDWIIEPAKKLFTRRRLQQRPKLDCIICRVPYSYWDLFSPYHYLTAELNTSARCFGLFVGKEIASFVAVLARPHSTKGGVKKIMGDSRTVTLPDWQGIGLAFVLMETIASAYTAYNYNFHIYPAHPPFIRACDRSPKWTLIGRPGIFNSTKHSTGRKFKTKRQEKLGLYAFTSEGTRPCATFRYVGEKMDYKSAKELLYGKVNFRKDEK